MESGTDENISNGDSLPDKPCLVVKVVVQLRQSLVQLLDDSGDDLQVSADQPKDTRDDITHSLVVWKPVVEHLESGGVLDEELDISISFYITYQVAEAHLLVSEELPLSDKSPLFDVGGDKGLVSAELGDWTYQLRLFHVDSS